MGEDTSRDWRWLVDGQRGVVESAQARQAGVTRGSLEHRLKSGKWRRLHHGVYATFTGEMPREATLWAAVRRAGDGAMLSHETAAEVQGLAEKPSPEIHITVPTRRRPAQNGPIRGVVIHRSDQSLPQRLPVWELPRTRIEDTVLDLVGTATTFDDAYTWISRAVSKKLLTGGMLRNALSARKRMRWRAWLTDALADADEGVLFPLELRYLRDVERAHGLPKARRQARRTIAGRTHYRDAWYEEYGVCVELDGAAYHDRDQVRRDKDRDNLDLAVDRVDTYRFSIVDVTEGSCTAAAMVAASLHRNGWQGTPHPCHRPECTVEQK
jgi:hypothetical protein